MKSPRDGIRKAAILVAALDQKAAALVLRQMEPDEAQAVRQMMAELGDIDPREQRRVVDEFFRIGPMVPEKDPPGIELDGRLAAKLSLRPVRTSGAESGDVELPEGPPFVFLRETESDKLARILAPERPQTIALVLAHLPSAQAGSVLSRLAGPLQVEVVQRLVDLEETDPEILHEVERGLRSRLAEQVPMQRRRVAGPSAVTGILQACDPKVGSQILDNLATHDPTLADRLVPRRFEFDELAALDSTSLRTVLGAVDPELLVLALTGQRESLAERVLDQLRPGQAEMVRRRLAHLEPVRLRDVEESRRRIVAMANRLLIEGRIQPPCGPQSRLVGIGA